MQIKKGEVYRYNTENLALNGTLWRIESIKDGNVYFKLVRDIGAETSKDTPILSEPIDGFLLSNTLVSIPNPVWAVRHSWVVDWPFKENIGVVRSNDEEMIAIELPNKIIYLWKEDHGTEWLSSDWLLIDEPELCISCNKAKRRWISIERKGFYCWSCE